MAHFAKIGMNGKVISVTPLENKNLLNADGVEDERVGQEYLERCNNWPAQMWIQTSYNTKQGKYYNADNTEHSDQSKAFRGNYAGIGMTWDEDNQIFIFPKPHASWTLDIPTASWVSPIGNHPEFTDEQVQQVTAGTHSWEYRWNESTQSWDLIDKKA